MLYIIPTLLLIIHTMAVPTSTNAFCPVPESLSGSALDGSLPVSLPYLDDWSASSSRDYPYPHQLPVLESGMTESANVQETILEHFAQPHGIVQEQQPTSTAQNHAFQHLLTSSSDCPLRETFWLDILPVSDHIDFITNGGQPHQLEGPIMIPDQRAWSTESTSGVRALPVDPNIDHSMAFGRCLIRNEDVITLPPPISETNGSVNPSTLDWELSSKDFWQSILINNVMIVGHDNQITEPISQTGSSNPQIGMWLQPAAKESPNNGPTTPSSINQCGSPSRKRRKRWIQAGSTSAHLSEDFGSCSACGAVRDANGKFRLPLHESTNQSCDEKLQQAHQYHRRYQHHKCSELTRSSYGALYSSKAIVNCFRAHCHGNVTEFDRRHPCWTLRSFSSWNCSGKQLCNYIQMADRRKKFAASSRKSRTRKQRIMPANYVSNIRQPMPDSSPNAGACIQCGLSPNLSGRFSLPHMEFADAKTIEDKLKAVRTFYLQYRHHTKRTLASSSYYRLLSTKHILICFDRHCGGDTTEFNKRHPKFAVDKFRVMGCSGSQNCNYLERAEYSTSRLAVD